MIFKYELQGKVITINYLPKQEDFIDYLMYVVKGDEQFIKHPKTTKEVLYKLVNNDCISLDTIAIMDNFYSFMRDKCSLLACEKCEEELAEGDLEMQDITVE